LPRWANRHLPRGAAPSLVRALRDARGALLFATGTSLTQRRRGVLFACRSGVLSACPLTVSQARTRLPRPGMSAFRQYNLRGIKMDRAVQNRSNNAFDGDSLPQISSCRSADPLRSADLFGRMPNQYLNWAHTTQQFLETSVAQARSSLSLDLKVNFVSKLIVKSVTFEVNCRFSWNRRGNRAACTTAQTSAVSLTEYCKVTTQHQLARVPSVSCDARRACRSGQSGKGQKHM
jgi:hypothetical protein